MFLHVLVIASDLNTRLQIAGILRKLRCKVEAYGNPQTAWIVLGAVNNFDVVFIDLNMPRGEGIEFARRVKLKYPDLPVVLTSPSMPTFQVQREAESLATCIFADHTPQHYEAVLIRVMEYNTEEPSTTF